MNTYMLGTTVRLSVAFTVNATASDPTTPSAQVRAPNGTVTTLALTHDGAGAYHADTTPTVAGLHTWRALGVGFAGFASASAASEAQFYIAASGLTS
jgi:hypothetical protein